LYVVISNQQVKMDSLAQYFVFLF